MTRNPYSLFDHYKNNLNLVRLDSRIVIRPDRDDIVICPLCFDKFFTEENLNDHSLSVEHVPPESLGGKELALTCRNCNRSQGSSVDSFLVSYINDLDAMRGDSAAYLDGI